MTSMHDAAHPPCRCPLCGQPNGCAMEAAQALGGQASDCWCVQVNFSAELLARVPAALQRQACICKACATATPAPKS